ncbi:MAG TPA: shikimate dehydrogenase [Saprospiraceae bacterium]|nr:shikimate dehydrogenase [Saprospiraceae bacterium]
MKFGLIGYPLSHSFSQEYFTKKFQSLGLEDFSYQLLPLVDINEVVPLLQQDFIGFNVTIPYKEKIIPFLDELDPVSEAIGAVNTVVKTDLGRWKGYNTDASGFEESLLQWLGSSELPEKALVLGTGGASKAVRYVLQRQGVEVSLVSRSFHAQYTYGSLDRNVIKNHLLIINTTPVGMYPHADQSPSIPYAALTPDHWLYDLIYNPGNTLFLARGEQAGAMTKNGLEMLRLQADHAWAIWKLYGKF